MPKLRMRTEQARAVEEAYNYLVSQETVGRLLTTSLVEELQKKCLRYQERKRNTETNPAWELPFRFELKTGENLVIVVLDLSNVLFLDQ